MVIQLLRMRHGFWQNSYCRKSAYEKDPDGYNENPIDGPYVLKEYKEGKYMLLTVNDNYWKEKPAIKNVKVQVVNDSVLADSILNGDIDFLVSQVRHMRKLKKQIKTILQFVKIRILQLDVNISSLIVRMKY